MRHAQGGVHRPRELTSRVAQVSGGERDDAEAEIREEGQGDARDDVRERRIPAEGQKVEVDVHQRHGDEDGEDGEQDDDDQRLRSIHDTRADEVDRGHCNDDRGGEDVVPPARSVVADEERGRVAPERDRHHRAHDHDRCEVAEPGGDADEATVPEAFDQVGDQTTRRRVAHAELDDGVAEECGDDAGEEERQPDRRAGDHGRLAEQREDACADHRADAEEGGAADGHAMESSVPAARACGRRRRARRSGCRRAR